MGTKITLKTLQECIEEFRDDFKSTTTQIQEDLIAVKEKIIQNLLEENQRLRKRVADLEEKAAKFNDDFVEITKAEFEEPHDPNFFYKLRFELDTVTAHVKVQRMV